jgi:tetrahydromethanopterin S-methyltransferase subunit E
MLTRFWSSVARIVARDIGGPLKAVLFFDINRMLFWDVSGTPIPRVVWKALAGYVAVVVLLEMMR